MALTADIDEDLSQEFLLYGSTTATVKRRKTNKSPHHRQSGQETLDMINEERRRALKGIAEEQPQPEHPARGISSAFPHAYLASMTEQIT